MDIEKRDIEIGIAISVITIVNLFVYVLPIYI